MTENLEKFGQKLAEKMIAAGMASPRSFRGCTPEEIQQIIRSQQVNRLPIVYHQYLLYMGRYAGGYFFRGTDVYYPDILGFKEAAIELLLGMETTLTLKQTDFVFQFHQGYHFLYFNSEEDDPDVISVGEAQKTPKNLGPLSSWYFRCVDEMVDYRARYNDY